MTSPFRSEIVALREQLRRAEEANAVVADEILELDEELALRGGLLGPSRGMVRVVLWGVAALATLSLGGLLGYAAAHYKRAPAQSIMASPEAQRREKVSADADRCQRSQKDARERLAACTEHAP